MFSTSADYAMTPQLLKSLKIHRVRRLVSWSQMKDQPEAPVRHILTTMAGHIESWEQLIEISAKKDSQIYLVVINVTQNYMVQFRDPHNNLTFTDKTMHYAPTRETACQRQFMNRDFIPSFFVFDNYMHYHALKVKMKAAGYEIKEDRFD